MMLSRCSSHSNVWRSTLALLVLVLVVRARAEGAKVPAELLSVPPQVGSSTVVTATAGQPTVAAKPLGAPAAGQPAAGEAAPKSETPPARPRAVDEIRGLLNLGASLTDRGDFESAEIAFRQALVAPGASLTDLKSALLGLARMHRRQGALTKAAAIYERYLKDYPGDERTPDALLDLGRTLRALGAYKSAIARFYSVINSTLKMPGEGFAHYQLLAKTAQFEIAETHFAFGHFNEAAKFYTRLRLLDLAPADRARAHFKAGYALHQQGDLEGAVTTLRAFLDQWPEDEHAAEARSLLVTALRTLKRSDDALVAIRELLRSGQAQAAADPKRWLYWQRRTGNQLANDFFENGDPLNARAIYRALLELSTEPEWRLPLTYQIGLCNDRLGLFEEARACYERIVQDAAAMETAAFGELAKMAVWRLDHVDWRARVDGQVKSYFDTPVLRDTPVPSATGEISQ